MNKYINKCESGGWILLKTLAILYGKSYISTRKRNKIFGVGCKSQPAVQSANCFTAAEPVTFVAGRIPVPTV